jgi:hypothetical protein
LARLDDKIEALQEQRQRYESVLGKLLAAAAAGDKPLTGELPGELDDWRDDFDHKIDAARGEMRWLASAAIVGTRDYQRRVVAIGVVLLAIPQRSASPLQRPSRSAWCVRCAACCSAPPQSKAVPSILWSRLPRATKSVG